VAERKINLWKKAGLYYHTARYLKPIQLLHRARKQVASRLVPASSVPSPETVQFELAGKLIPPRLLLSRRNVKGCVHRAEQVLAGRFEFIGEAAEGKRPVDWEAPERSRLWRFFLHSFDYAFDLGVAYQETARGAYFTRLQELVCSWVDANTVIRDDSWHPYPTSLRIVNWILASILFWPLLKKDSGFQQLLFGSIHWQAKYLYRHLEYDLLANHLLKNIKALFIASRFFSDGEARRWKTKAGRLLTAQLQEQILPDGCHFERSPMYHCVVLQDVLDCLPFLDPNEGQLRELMTEKSIQMLFFLKSILLGDGQFPLFNDSVFNMGPAPAELLAYAKEVLGGYLSSTECASRVRAKSVSVLYHKASGYVVAETPRMKLVIDGGKLGPDYQLGHAHCDLFSFELAIGKSRVIVDSGTPTYEEGELRTLCRSTRAHNTVMIDGEEQAEIWKSFRVARRPTPKDVRVVRQEGFVYFEGKHDGYRWLPGKPVHKRTLFLIEGALLVVVDEITGKGEHQVQSFLHLHPAVDVERDTWIIRTEQEEFQIFPLEGVEVDIENGFYAPHIGSLQESPVICFKSQGELPLWLGYALAPATWRLQSFRVEETRGALMVESSCGRYLLMPEANDWKLVKEK